MLLHFECYVGSGTPILSKALETNQGAQTKQETAGVGLIVFIGKPAAMIASCNFPIVIFPFCFCRCC